MRIKQYGSMAIPVIYSITLLLIYPSFEVIPITFAFMSISYLFDKRVYLVLTSILSVFEILKGSPIILSLLPIIGLMGYILPKFTSSLSIALLFTSVFYMFNVPASEEFASLILLVLGVELLGMDIRSFISAGILTLVISAVAYSANLVTISNQISMISFELLLTGVLGLIIPERIERKAGATSLISSAMLLYSHSFLPLAFLAIGSASFFPPAIFAYSISYLILFHNFTGLEFLGLMPLYLLLRLFKEKVSGLFLFGIFSIFPITTLLAIILGGLTGLVYKRVSFLVASIISFIYSYLTYNLLGITISSTLAISFSILYLAPNLPWNNVLKYIEEGFRKWEGVIVIGIAGISAYLFFQGYFLVAYITFGISLLYFLSNIRAPNPSRLILISLISPIASIFSLFLDRRNRLAWSIFFIEFYAFLTFLNLNLIEYGIGTIIAAISTIFSFKWKYYYLIPASLIIPAFSPILFLLGYNIKDRGLEATVFQIASALAIVPILLSIHFTFPLVWTAFYFLEIPKIPVDIKILLYYLKVTHLL
ncbi:MULTISPECIES: hypothetical protein [Acidianus]|uniref:Uncharacterized protein n=1 Tax=Candidatus Acidianus copahuensis TaxID=1160895 RepID=A0A031LU30_9CREN|nr:MULTISPECIES: hypothetical protein [Acidianus]EZQ10618.1 hypothetical protein CM19_03745 [Candidatus Acidianus copahuensis]NON61833.1 hypothetical protein [Acidianus sp. RZ1]